MGKRRNTWIANYASILALLCIFIIGSLVLMNVGVHVYKNIVENNAENFRLRASLSYLATRVRQYDTADTVSVREEDGVPMLVFAEELEGVTYLTRIYCYNGNMMELFQEEGLEHDLNDGFEIMELDDLQIEQQENQILLTAMDGGEKESLTLSLRSGRTE